MNDRFFRFCRLMVRMYLKPYAVVTHGCSETVSEMAPVLAPNGPYGGHQTPEAIQAGAPVRAGKPAGIDDSTAVDDSGSAGPAIYIVHHQNLRGPITSMAWFNRPMRPWVLSAFCERKACFRQFYDYTFTQRLHWPPFLAAIVTWPISFLVPALMHSMNALPVHRDPRETIKTFRQSLETLAAGNSLLISPDVDYADSSEAVGALYEGFLNLGKHYRRDTGRQVPFVPLHIDVPGRRILVGKAVLLRDDIPFKEARSEASRLLRCAMQDMTDACE